MRRSLRGDVSAAGRIIVQPNVKLWRRQSLWSGNETFVNGYRSLGYTNQKIYARFLPLEKLVQVKSSCYLHHASLNCCVDLEKGTF